MSQLFFSLSVSMGIMITYGSYVKDDVDLNKANSQIEIFDTGVAFLAGIMIIPSVYVFLGVDGMASGPSLTFILSLIHISQQKKFYTYQYQEQQKQAYKTDNRYKNANLEKIY